MPSIEMATEAENENSEMMVYVHTVTTEDACKDAVNGILQLSPPAIAVTCKREGKGDLNSSMRLGSISWLLIATEHHCFIFDIMQNPNLITGGHIKCLLENTVIRKVMHDCKFDSVCLYNMHGIQLANVFDTQAGQAAYESQLSRLSTYDVPPKSIIEVLKEHDDTFPYPLGKMVHDFEKDSINVWGQRPLNCFIRDYLIQEVCSLLHKTYPFLYKNLHPFKKKAAMKISELNIIRFIDPEECTRRETERLKKHYFEKITSKGKGDATTEENQKNKQQSVAADRKRQTANSPQQCDIEQNKRMKMNVGSMLPIEDEGTSALMEVASTDDEEEESATKFFCRCCNSEHSTESGQLVFLNKSTSEQLQNGTPGSQDADGRSCPSPDTIVETMNKLMDLWQNFTGQKDNVLKVVPQERNGKQSSENTTMESILRNLEDQSKERGFPREISGNGSSNAREHRDSQNTDAIIPNFNIANDPQLPLYPDINDDNQQKEVPVCGKNCPFCAKYGIC